MFISHRASRLAAAARQRVAADFDARRQAAAVAAGFPAAPADPRRARDVVEVAG